MDNADRFFWARRMDDSTYENVNGLDTYYVMFDDNDLDWLKSISRIRESKLSEALPSNAKALAKKAGKEKEAEKLWKKAVKIAEEEKGKKEKDFKDSDFAYAMGVFKNMLGIKEKKLTKKDFMSLHKSNQILLVQGGIKMTSDAIQKHVEGLKDSDFETIKGQPVSSVDVGSQSSSGLIVKVSSFENRSKTFFIVENTIDNSKNSDVSWDTIDVYSNIYIVKEGAIKESKMIESFKKGDKVTTKKGDGIVVGNEGTSPPMVKVKMDSGEELVFREKKQNMKEKMSYINRPGSFRINAPDGTQWQVIEMYGDEVAVTKADKSHFYMARVSDVMEGKRGFGHHYGEFEQTAPDFAREMRKFLLDQEMIGGKAFNESKTATDTKETFLESNTDAKTWLENQFPPEGDMEETMTSGSATSVGLPENPGKKKIEDSEKDDRDLIEDDRDPLDK